MRHVAVVLILLAMSLFPSPSRAASDPAYRMRADQLLGILSAPGREENFFSTLFLDAVPIDRWRVVAAELRAAHGRPVAVGAVSRSSPTAGQVEIRYERATIGFSLVVAPEAPNPVVGLHVVGAKAMNDTPDKVAAEIAALPGATAFAVARLDDSGPSLIRAHRANARMAIASSFKLLILAEAARATAAGERHWTDVMPLGPKSFSGRLAEWPDQAPMTLHSLATAMIAESDNSAADTLLLALGRAKVDAMLSATGHADPASAMPVLTTAETFALKMPANRDLLARYAAASLDQRRLLLKDEAARLTAGQVDVGSVAEVPTAIGEAEWFASPRDMIGLLDWLRVHGGDALPIMAVNPGIPPADAKRWRYLGYKGGSEPGVMAINLLAQGQDGRWYAISASWNNPAARLDEGRFTALVTRLMNLLSDGGTTAARW
ncbi:serine hydrolase [Sphingobium sp. CCH11-B1]|uniref:serine hydrolase n=1 Tax=Sphingobium sp. CCH11-B1 TaxID=1768781 RepID=UPI00082F3DCD|nr:serine hydrolase [Sphingobium sp. CCH11-B1]MEA3390630.1 serine hydrolase [Pseudomonadota bacterium]